MTYYNGRALAPRFSMGRFEFDPSRAVGLAKITGLPVRVPK